MMKSKTGVPVATQMDLGATELKEKKTFVDKMVRFTVLVVYK